MPRGIGEPHDRDDAEGRRQRESRTVQGVVTEALPNSMFSIQLDNGTRVLGHIPGTQRGRFVRLVPGDRVTLEVSPYDLSRGRIIERHR